MEKKLRKRLQEAIDKRNVMQAALAEIPEDAPDATKRQYQDAVEKADVIVAAASADLLNYETVGRARATRASIVAGLVLFLLCTGGLFFAAKEHPSYETRPARQQTERIQNTRKTFTVTAHNQQAFATAAAHNIACQELGFAGTVVEDVECFPDGRDACPRARVTMVCTTSKADHDYYRRELERLASQIGR